MIDLDTVFEEKSKIFRSIRFCSGFHECCIPVFICMMDIGTMIEEILKIFRVIRY